MATTIRQEMFRFMSTRRADVAKMHDIESRLVRDLRVAGPGSLLVKLYGPGDLDSQIKEANQFATTKEFVTADDAQVRALEPAVAFLRDRLITGVSLATLGADFRAALPKLAALLENAPPPALRAAVTVLLGRLWDSLYAQTLRGWDRYVSTNYLVDALRVYQVLRLMWLSGKVGLETWTGFLDGYDTIIDLEAAARGASDAPPPNDDQPQGPTIDLLPLQELTRPEIAGIDQVRDEIKGLVEQGGRGGRADAGGPEAGSGRHERRNLEVGSGARADRSRRDRGPGRPQSAAASSRRLRAAPPAPFPGDRQSFGRGPGPAIGIASGRGRGGPKHADPAAADGDDASAVRPSSGPSWPSARSSRRSWATCSWSSRSCGLRGRRDRGHRADLAPGERREQTIRKLARTSPDDERQRRMHPPTRRPSLTTDERFALSSSEAQQTAAPSVGM